jgi:hypothetical protein
VGLCLASSVPKAPPRIWNIKRNVMRVVSAMPRTQIDQHVSLVHLVTPPFTMVNPNVKLVPLAPSTI